MKRTLVVYYSLGGTSKFIADMISEELKCEKYKIELKRNFVKKSFLKYFKSILLSVFKISPALKPVDIDLSMYENIVICSPVWVTNISAPVRSFFKTSNLKDKNIYLLYCYYEGVANMVEKFEKISAGNKIVLHRGFKTPFRNTVEITKQIEEVVKTII